MSERETLHMGGERRGTIINNDLGMFSPGWCPD